MQFVVIAQHSAEMCPTSNSKIRGMMKLGAKEIPGLAQRLGIKIVSLNVYGPDHQVLALVEAQDIERVRGFVMEGRLVQWNTTTIHATWTLEEALAKADKLPAIFSRSVCSSSAATAGRYRRPNRSFGGTLPTPPVLTSDRRSARPGSSNSPSFRPSGRPVR